MARSSLSLLGMNRVTALACSIACSFLFACGAADDARDEARDGIDIAAERAGLTGTWNGTWNDESGKSGVARFEAKQDGLSIVGTVTFEDNPCLHTATMSAHVETDGVSAMLDFGNTKLSYAASLSDGTSLDGAFESILTGGPCENQHGVLSLVK